MPTFNVSINETSTVNHILETSIAASEETGQAYAIVTFDLAVARKAYSLAWQFIEKYSNVIVRMSVSYYIHKGKCYEVVDFRDCDRRETFVRAAALRKLCQGSIITWH